MEEIVVHDKTFVPYLSAQKIEEAIKQMADRLRRDMEGKDPLYVCIMNGAFMFAAELLKQLPGNQEVAFARYSSYQGTQSTFELKEITPVTTSLKDRVVVLLEDLIDTGYTMKCVKENFLSNGAKEVYIATMLIKPDSIKCDIKADYVGLPIESGFIVGHGLDYNDRGRTLNDIYILKE